jgi:NitT/TauT family transport system ATP-binding protein
MSGLVFHNVTLSYDAALPAVDQASFAIRPGEFLSLVGRSGCGKTTVLKLASGLLQPDHGTIELEGIQVTVPGRNVGIVFQSPTLLEWKSIRDNLLLPIALRRKPTGEDKERADSLLAMMGLRAHADKYPTELSGGQQSRVAIARALLQDPAVLLMDEPFAALDAITREELQDELLQMSQQRSMTVLFITHDIPEAVYLSDRVAVMEQGRFLQDVTIPLDKPRIPEMRYSSSFTELSLTVRRVMEGGSR